jgi:hypothetical protein
MSETEVGTAELRRSANEINWRHVWLTNVMINTGKFGPPKIAHRRMPTGTRASAQTSSYESSPRAAESVGPLLTDLARLISTSGSLV